MMMSQKIRRAINLSTLKMSKPQFVFFKMHGCGHCTNFSDKPTPQTSTWAQLKADKELASKVEFLEPIEWGVKRNSTSGEVTRAALPEKYKFVNYGPYFYLQNANDSTKGFEMKGVSRTHEGMKAWILEMLRTKPELSRGAAPTAAPPASAVNANLPSNIQERIEARRARVAAFQQQSQRSAAVRSTNPAATPEQAAPAASPVAANKFTQFANNGSDEARVRPPGPKTEQAANKVFIPRNRRR